MSLILTFLASVAAKVVSKTGLQFAETILKGFTIREEEGTKRLGTYATAFRDALDYEVQARRVASSERVALWHDPFYKGLIILIVAPPAIYHASVYADSIFNFDFDILSAPARFEDIGANIILTFIGSTGAVGAFSTLKGIWRK